MNNTSSTWCFPEETVKFLKNLHANNNREWFTEYKSAYETSVKKPAEFFAAIMAAKLQSLTGHTYSSKVFRVYRDVRFSKDKTPYNTHVHIGFTPEGLDTPGWYFGLDTEKLSVGVGTFAFEGDKLETYRQRIVGEDGNALAVTLKKIEKNSGFRIMEPELKRVPRQFDPDHVHAALLRRKGLTVWYDFPDLNTATRGDLISACNEKYTILKPVFDWLIDL
ncbi:DUF2461 domain-containing protein [Kordiimonas aquimaris]|uniref:DUF2461 domain-containing protein n=1 Tax=Kordiimonas aquimaris TaxID=707591 RepID=UPI0021CE540A|nr:TIGR02453 family protein [Kordiimonas aquimaris]